MRSEGQESSRNQYPQSKMFWELFLKIDEMAFKESEWRSADTLMKYVVYTKEILLFRQSHQRSALFHWVPNVNSCSVFIISTTGDSLNQSKSSSIKSPLTKSGIIQSITKAQSQHWYPGFFSLSNNGNKSNLTALFPDKFDYVDEFKPVIQLPGVHNLFCWFNKGFCINNRQSAMSGEGLQRGSEAATCNQGRSESLQGNCRDLAIPDGVLYASPTWHVKIRHYLSHLQQAC